MTPKHARAQLTMKDVSKSYGDRTVLDQVSFTVRPGDRVGVIGENGSGKSTLLRLLAEEEAPDSGEITVRFPGGTGYLSQTLPLAPDRTVQDAVDTALAELRELERDIRTAEEALTAARTPDESRLAAYGDLLTAYEERGGYQADTRVDTALHGLGLAHLARERPSARCPVANSPGSRSPAYWHPPPNFCCSTSRPTTSTSAPPPGWRSTCVPTAAPSSSSPTTGPSWSGPPPSSWRSTVT